ncbi:MAG: hypothetical protein PVI21_03630 [Candidatus Woesebacteria bacterium]|jgi:hypothetical protein
MKNKVLAFLTKPSVVLFFGFFIFFASLSTLLYASNTSDTVIRSDGKGYYLYLPATFIHHDISMQWTEYLQKSDPFYSGSGEWYGLTESQNGNYLNKYTIGLAILWAPFFVSAHIAANMLGLTPDGFSAIYNGAIAIAAAFYTSLACIMLYKLFARHFSAKASLLTTIAIALGTNLLNYATSDGCFTHVYSLFLISSVLYLTSIWYKKPSYKLSVGIAAIFALAVLVRQTTIIFAIIPILWNVCNIKQLKERLALFWQRRKYLFAMAASSFAVILPQLIYWKIVSGNWLVFSYQGESFNFANPQIINILFSTDRGVFFWAPILTISLIGLVLAKKYLKEWAIGIYVFLPIWLWVVSSWHSWQFGMSYGHRAFIDVFPIFGLLIALTYSKLNSKILKNCFIIFCTLCILASLFLTHLYWISAVPAAGTTWDQYVKIWQHETGLIPLRGLTSGFLGLIGLIALTLAPALLYFLHKTNNNRG